MKAAAEVPLGEVADFINGVAFKPSDWSDTGARIIRIQNLTDPSKPYNRTRREVPQRARVDPGDLLVSWSATLGVFEWAGDDVAVLNQHIFRVVPNARLVTTRYLKHLLVSAIADMERHLHGATMKHVNRGEFLSTTIPVPCLDDQRRIARVLDAADALRVKRRRAIEHAAFLSGAAFSALFEPPVARARLARLGELLERIESGRSPVCAGRPAVDDEWGVLKLGAISYGTYRPHENKALLPGCTYKPEHEVRDGDVLLTRKNTRELVGSSVLVRSTPPRRLLPDLMFRLVPAGDSGLRPAYLQAALARPSVRASIARLAGGSAGSMPNISKERLRSVEIVVPSLAAQLEYETILSMHGALSDRLQHHLGQLETLFASLQHRAFTGAL